MFCKECGIKVDENTKYCPNCGQPVVEQVLSNNGDSGIKNGKGLSNRFAESSQEKDSKGISKVKNIVGIVSSCAVLILLLMAFLGKFDNVASKFGWGRPDSESDISTATVPTEKSETGKEELEREEKGELSSFLGCTEEDLIKGCNFERNDFGTYPDMEHAIFICLEGKLNSISLRSANEDSKDFTIFGICVGDLSESVSEKLQKNFTICDSSIIENGTRDIYVENKTGYYLAVDSDDSGNIFGVGYTLSIEDDMEDAAESAQISIPATYGTYVFDNGVDAVCTAEVGFTTDENSSDYINISAMGYGGHELTAFYGDMVINQEGNYEAYCEYLNTTILIIFDETGMNIEILSCDDSSMMESIVGKYLLTAELNLNEVG